MTNPRQRICNAIAQLSESCTSSEVQDALDPLFREYQGNKDIGTGITPLVLACDQGNAICLEYLNSKYKDSPWASECIGDPFYRSPEDQNTPLHHAAMVGCVHAISILCDMGASPLALGSARNSHGDTPLMMAVASGHLEFCRIWHEKCCCISPLSTESVLRTWALTNDSGDSCLTLACGHGHARVVDFLLSSDCGVSIDCGIILKCQTLYERMEDALRRQPSLVHDRKDLIVNVRQCQEILETKAARLAETAAHELINMETTEAVPSQESISKRKSRRSRTKKNQKHIDVSIPLNSHSSRASTPCHIPQQDRFQVTTLHDGSKAVRVQGFALPEPSPVLAVKRIQPSADELFRNRFHQGRICSEVDSTMRALCLDMSMLLYTPHGMAIDLSPSQLDAVEDILERQLKGIREARKIQERLHTWPGNEATEL